MNSQGLSTRRATYTVRCSDGNEQLADDFTYGDTIAAGIDWEYADITLDETGRAMRSDGQRDRAMALALVAKACTEALSGDER